jgi:hypothetical protein
MTLNGRALQTIADEKLEYPFLVIMSRPVGPDSIRGRFKTLQEAEEKVEALLRKKNPHVRYRIESVDNFTQSINSPW